MCLKIDLVPSYRISGIGVLSHGGFPKFQSLFVNFGESVIWHHDDNDDDYVEFANFGICDDDSDGDDDGYDDDDQDRDGFGAKFPRFSNTHNHHYQQSMRLIIMMINLNTG